jgi:hypothetical protein
LNLKGKNFETILDINSSINNPISTKISSVKFLDSEKIIIYVDTFNVFKNQNIKNILLFNRNYRTLSQFDNTLEVEDIIYSRINLQKSFISYYNELLKDNKFLSLIELWNLFDDTQKNLSENLKITTELRSLEDKILFYSSINQNNELISFVKKYINLLIKNNLHYRLLDFFFFYYRINEKKIFSNVENREEVMKELFQNIILQKDDLPESLIDLINNNI